MKHFHKPLCNHDCGALRHFFGVRIPSERSQLYPFFLRKGENI